jgi:hypothetical protein
MSTVDGSIEPRHERLKKRMRQPAVRRALQAGPVPLAPDAIDWLARLLLLDGLPFEAIVPVASMLPPESLRFFHVDDHWLDALLNGALSVADRGPDHARMLERLRVQVGAEARSAAAELRMRTLAGAASARVPAAVPGAPAKPPAQEARKPGAGSSGMLLRSSIVADVPGLSVSAFADDNRTEALRLLRIDHLSSTVLIALFDGVARRIEIAEPAHALHFGVTRSPDGQGPPRIELRRSSGPGLGTAPPGEPTVDVVLREEKDEQGGPQVIDIRKTVDELNAGLASAGEPAKLTSATLGVQLVRAQRRAVFICKP